MIAAPSAPRTGRPSPAPPPGASKPPGPARPAGGWSGSCAPPLPGDRSQHPTLHFSENRFITLNQRPGVDELTHSWVRVRPGCAAAWVGGSSCIHRGSAGGAAGGVLRGPREPRSAVALSLARERRGPRSPVPAPRACAPAPGSLFRTSSALPGGPGTPNPLIAISCRRQGAPSPFPPHPRLNFISPKGRSNQAKGHPTLGVGVRGDGGSPVRRRKRVISAGFLPKITG